MELPRSLPVTVPVVLVVDIELAPPTVIVEVEPTLLGVGGGMLVSIKDSEARSSLFPTNIILKFGDASARASLRNG